MKKLIGIIVLMLLTLTSSFADKEVETLSELGLISGDSNGYHLESDLTRAEAATFIVKLLGEEKHVNDKKIMYSNSNFTDIQGDEWYAPYIGYCERHNILSGYPDQTIRADEALSEKAFLVMVLKAMKISDITWDKVYDKAIEEEIVSSDIANKSFKRKDVVKILYRIINHKNEDNISFLENLVAKGIVSKEKVNALGILPVDEIVLGVESIKSNRSNQIVILVNEDILPFDASQVKIRQASHPIEVHSVHVKDKVITITSDQLLEGITYDVLIEGLFDHHLQMKDIEAKVLGYEVKPLQSDYFIISKVTAMSNNYVKVEFTQPVTDLSRMVLNFYKDGKVLNSGYAISISEGNDKTWLIHLRNMTFVEGEIYTLKIERSLTSNYGESLNQGSDQMIDFVGSNAAFPYLVEMVELMPNKHVRIIFNRNAKDYSALTYGSSNTKYELIDLETDEILTSTVNILSGTGNLKRRQVDIYFPDMKDGHEYELIFPIKKDALGGSVIEDGRYPIHNDNISIDDLKVVESVTESNQKIVMTFNRDLSPWSTSAEVSGLSIALITYDKNNPRKLTFYLDKKHTSDKSITLSKICDIYGEKYETTCYVDGSKIDKNKTSIVESEWIGEDKVLLRFSDAVSPDYNFRMAHVEDASAEKIFCHDFNIIDSSTVILSFEGKKIGETCVITIPNYHDVTSPNTIYNLASKLTF